MVKTLKNSLRSERFWLFGKPRSAQQSIPIDRIFKDGMWKTGPRISKCWRFTDINYAVAADDAQKNMLASYRALLNALPPDASTKMTIFNRRMNEKEFKRNVLLPSKYDGLDDYRGEINRMLLEKTDMGNGIIREKFITVSSEKRSEDEARIYFNRISNDLTMSFGRLSSGVKELDIESRLRLLHDFFRIGEESKFSLDLFELASRGHSFKDLICPDSIQFFGSHFTMGDKFGRVMFLKNYSSSLTDDFISDFTDFPLNLMLSIDILPVPTDEAIKELNRFMLAVESDIARHQNRQNASLNWSAIIPFMLEQNRNTARESMEDITSRDQRMFFGLLTLVHLADSLEELDTDTENFMAVAQKHVCDMSILRAQQEPGLNTVLPYGMRSIETVRTFTTESAGILMPFHCQEILDKSGIYYGQSALSRNLIICDRTRLQNPHSWILGVSGSGKSLSAKFLIAMLILSTEDDVIVLDPESEYSSLIRAMGGVVADISASSSNHINALDINRDYGGDENPLILKSEFVMSLCEQIMDRGSLGANQKSIIDRCMSLVYRDYGRDFRGTPPTFLDFYNVLRAQPEDEAKKLALALELFTTGSLSVFSKQTNIDINSRVLSFNLYKLGKQLMNVGMLVTLDCILNRVSANRESGKRTHIFIDEMHLYFQHDYSGQVLANAWKRFRKYNAYLTGLTQNVTEVADSPHANLMLANSEFLILLNQAAHDRQKLATHLNISEAQLSYITNAEAGHGLIRVGGSMIPFFNEVNTNTALYRLISTKPGEG